jgi:predicted nucleic acid-binding protein
MDDRRGVLSAERPGISVAGTLGVLNIAADRGLIDFAEVIQRLDTNLFRKTPVLLQGLDPGQTMKHLQSKYFHTKRR